MRRTRLVLKNPSLIAILIVILPVLMITVGFSALTTSLSINGTARFDPVGMIVVTSITPEQSTGSNSISASHTYNTITTTSNLATTSGQAIYNVKIKNLGQTNKTLSNIISQEFSNNDMIYSISGMAIGDVFIPGQVVDVILTISYKAGVSEPSATTVNSIIEFVFDDYEIPYAVGYFMPYDSANGLFGFNKSTITGFKRNTTLSRSQVLAQSGVQQIQNVSEDQYNSETEIYGFVDSDGVFNWWSAAEVVYFHPHTTRAFKDLGEVLEIDLTGTDTSKVENFAHWFDKDRKLVRIIGKLNTSGLKLEYNINYDYLNTSDDTTSNKGLSFLFNDCNALQEVDLTEIDTTNASDLKRMFGGCRALPEIDVSHFNTTNARSMHWMFRNCNSVTELDVSSFDTSNVVNFYAMFNQCANLRVITLGENFNTSNGIIMSRVFNGLTNLTTINARRDFSTESMTQDSNMFYNCTKLVGGAGTDYSTKYNGSYITSSRAKVATPDTRGYFTLIGDMVLYTIAYTLNGGTGNNPTSYSVASSTFTLQAPTKPGYTFTGWTGSNGNTEQTSVTILQGTIGNKHYEAHWEANNYTVQFAGNGGEGSMPMQEFTYDVSAHLRTNTFTRDGYTFNGWNTAQDGSGTSFVDGHEVANITTSGVITLYAQWIEATNPFPTVFHINGSCTINGTGKVTGETCNGYNNSNIINTGIYLYSSENRDKDFEIGFTVDHFVPSEQTISQATFINSKLENSSLKYPGFVYRILNSTQNEITATFGNNKQTHKLSVNTPQTIKIARKDRKIYFSVNGGAYTQLIDQSSYTGNFNVPVTFGASIDNNGNPYRQLINTTISNMYIKIGTMDSLN